MNNILIKIHKPQHATQQFQLTPTNSQTYTIKATANNHIELLDGQTKQAPKQIHTKKVNQDLHISLNGEHVDLIVQDYYQQNAELVGLSGDRYQTYTSVNSHPTTQMTVQTLSHEAPVAWWTNIATGSQSALPWMFGGLGAIGVATAVSGGRDTVSPIKPPVTKTPKQENTAKPPVTETPKQENPTEPPVTETPKQENPTEPPVAETPKQENPEPPVTQTPKQEAPAEPPVTQTPKQEDPAEPPVAETSKQENPEPPVTKTPKQENPEPPVTETPKQENPTEPPVAETPKQENPTEPPVTETPKQEDPAEPPVAETPKQENPAKPPVAETSKQENPAKPPVTETNEQDNQPLSISIKPTQNQSIVNEGDFAEFEVKLENRPNDEQTLTLQLTQSGTITASDLGLPIFTQNFSPVDVKLDNQTLTIGAGITDFTISYPTMIDQIPEGNETLILQLDKQSATVNVSDVTVNPYNETVYIPNPDAQYDPTTNTITFTAHDTGSVPPIYELLPFSDTNQIDAYLPKSGEFIDYIVNIHIPSDNPVEIQAPTAYLTPNSMHIDGDTRRAIIVRDRDQGEQIIPTLEKDNNTLKYIFKDVPKDAGLAINTGSFSYKKEDNQATPTIQITTSEGYPLAYPQGIPTEFTHEIIVFTPVI